MCMKFNWTTCFHSCEIRAHHLRRQNRNVTKKSYTLSLGDHIHQQSSKSGHGKKPSRCLKLLANFMPNSHYQIMEGGIKQKAYKKKSKLRFFPLFLHLFIIQELQGTTQKLINCSRVHWNCSWHLLLNCNRLPTCHACGRAYYQTPVLEGAPLLVLAKTLPSFAVAHFRHLRAHWPETDLSIKL